MHAYKQHTGTEIDNRSSTRIQPKGHINYQCDAHILQIHTFLQCHSCYEIWRVHREKGNYLIHVYRHVYTHIHYTYTLYTYNDMS